MIIEASEGGRDARFTFPSSEDCAPAAAPDDLPAAAWQRILAAGLDAPLAGGRRGWRFLVIRDPRSCQELLTSAGVARGGKERAVIAVLALEAPWRRRAERLLAEAGRCRDFAAAAVRSSALARWLAAQAGVATGAMALATRSLGWQARVHARPDTAGVRRALKLSPAVAFASLVTIESRSAARLAGAGLSAAAR